MITKAIVEAIVDTYSFRVRIPVINRSKDAALHTPTEELYISSICTVAGCIPNVRVGDIVYVSFEDNDLSRPVILGYLYKDSYGDTLCDFEIGNLTVDGSAHLSKDTSIGNVTPSEISFLEGTKSNIQWQLDLFEKDIEFLKTGAVIPLEQQQSDWDEADVNSPSYIRNKPTIPVVDNVLTPDGTNPVAGGAIYQAIQDAGSAMDVGEVSLSPDAQNPNRFTFYLTTAQIDEITSSFEDRDDIPITLHGTIGGKTYYFTVSKAMLRNYLGANYMAYDGSAILHGEEDKAGVVEVGFSQNGCYLELSMIGDAAGTLNTTNTASLVPSADESLSGDINLHKVSKTGSYNDVNNKPSINGIALVGDKTSSDLGIDLVHTDTTANWNAQRDLVAARGHIYVYSDYQTLDGVPVPGLKVGDGSSYLIDMPFVGAREKALLEDHINDNVRHITAEEREFWNNKVTCFISSVDDENIVFTKHNV